MVRNKKLLIGAGIAFAAIVIVFVVSASIFIIFSVFNPSGDEDKTIPVSDQTAKISGQVTDAVGESVPDIAVYLRASENNTSDDDGKKIDTSDETGRFSFTPPQDGDYTLSAASKGAAAEADLSIRNGGAESTAGKRIDTIEINLPFYAQKPEALPANDDSDVITDKDGLLIIDDVLEIIWLNNVSAAEQKTTLADVGGLSVRGRIEELNLTEVKVESGDIETKAKQLKRSPRIKAAVKDYVLEAEYIPTDSDYKNKLKSWWLRKLDAEQVWEIVKRKRPRVAGIVVTDSGFQDTHPDLKKVFHTRLRRNYTGNPFTAKSKHGNHVSGIIAMQVNNLGSVGISPRTRIIPMKVKSFRDIAQAITLSSKIRKLSAISVSWGFKWRRVDKRRDDHGLPPLTQVQRQARSDNVDAYLMPAVTLAYNKGIAVVHSAGNDRLPASSNAMNNDAKVITVGATKLTDSLANFSNYGAQVDIGAPGQNIWSTIDNNRWKYYSGTSMSTPMVSGTIALMRSLNPDLTLSQVRDLLITSADKTAGGPRVRLNSWKAALAALGDSYGVEGKVVDERGSPLRNAIVSVDGTTALDVKTKKDGSFTLAIVPRDKLVIKAKQGQKEGQITLRALPSRTYVHENVKIKIKAKSTKSDDGTLDGKTFTLAISTDGDDPRRVGQINLRVVPRSDGTSGGFHLVGDFQINYSSPGSPATNRYRKVTPPSRTVIKGTVERGIISGYFPVNLGSERSYPGGFDVIFNHTTSYEDGETTARRDVEENQALRGEIPDDNTGSGTLRLGYTSYTWELTN